MAIMLQRVATLAFRRRRTFLAAWLLIIVAALGCYAALGSAINSEFTIPGSSSQNALDELQRTLPPAAGTSAQIVFESPAGTKITDRAYHAAVEATLDQAKLAPQVSAVVDPFTSKAISRDGRTRARRDPVHRHPRRTSTPTACPRSSPLPSARSRPA